MFHGRISNTLTHAMQFRQHRNFSRLLVATFMVFMVILVVTVFALSNESTAVSFAPRPHNQ